MADSTLKALNISNNIIAIKNLVSTFIFCPQYNFVACILVMIVIECKSNRTLKRNSTFRMPTYSLPCDTV